MTESLRPSQTVPFPVAGKAAYYLDGCPSHCQTSQPVLRSSFHQVLDLSRNWHPNKLLVRRLTADTTLWCPCGIPTARARLSISVAVSGPHSLRQQLLVVQASRCRLQGLVRKPPWHATREKISPCACRQPDWRAHRRHCCACECGLHLELGCADFIRNEAPMELCAGTCVGLSAICRSPAD